MNTSTLDLPDPAGWRGAQRLDHLTVLQAQGPEAAAFLHGQLSQDVEGLDAGQARLAAYCSPKGRMLADAVLLRPQPDVVRLLVSADVAPAVLKRLSMFVLRAKLAMSQVSPEVTVLGLLGEAAEAAPQQPWTTAPDSAPGDPAPSACWVRLPAVLGVARALWVGPADQAEAVSAQAPWQAPAGAWSWLAVMSGIPRIEAANVDQFVPQMINYELVGGVNFKKGCYPGQEVVARSQYRGTLKRRLFLLHAPDAVHPGQDVFAADDPGQPAGRIVNVGHVEGGPWSALAELKLQWAQGRLTAGSPEGPPLTVAPLPYAVTDGD